MTRKLTIVWLFSFIFLSGTLLAATPYTVKQIKRFQCQIVDRTPKLNRKYKKERRKKTDYIIVHTSEAGLGSTLRTVSCGKRMAHGRCTHGGHAHYVIARNGQTYRILDKKYVADHAGRSMWNGQTDISLVSIGIELEGYHYKPITAKQYRSLGILVEILRKIYRIEEANVLTHSQIAYGSPNRWYRHNHRGRKRCAKNFDRTKIGLTAAWQYDPDVKAGRLTADPILADLFYSPRPDGKQRIGTNIITKSNTAWAIAGGDYDAPETIYILPNGQKIYGDELGEKIGWNQIPHRTAVLLNQPPRPTETDESSPIQVVRHGVTAWTLAGSEYNNKTTYYIYPNGKIKNGRQISDWDDMPINTKVIMGYRRPLKMKLGKTPSQIAGKRYNHKKTLYYFPNKKLISGDRINDFKRMPAGVFLFLPTKENA